MNDTIKAIVTLRDTLHGIAGGDAILVVPHADGVAWKDFLQVLISVVTVAVVLIGFFQGKKLLRLKRELQSALMIGLETKVLRKEGNMLLAKICVYLENKGQVRISARRREVLSKQVTMSVPDIIKNYPISTEPHDVCCHAGTLKIRRLDIGNRPSVFNWYSLSELTGVPVIFDRVEAYSGNLEQINYLDEYQDDQQIEEENPKGDGIGSNGEKPGTNTDFWLEPKESYVLEIPVWLEPGSYAMKAIFLGDLNKRGEEDYWSCTKYFELRDVPITQEKRTQRTRRTSAAKS